MLSESGNRIFSTKMDLITTIKMQHIPESFTNKLTKSQAFQTDNKSVIMN